MKSTGIVLKIDELGRIVLPKEMRNIMKIEENSPLEIWVDGDKIVLRKYSPGCSFCDSVSYVSDYQGKRFCQQCLDKINKAAS